MIEITDEMKRVGLNAVMDVNHDVSRATLVRVTLSAVAPLIEAQARERALREAAKDTETFIIPYGVRRPTQFMMGQTTAAEQIRGAILNRIGAPQQSASTGANSATAENADQKTEAPSDGW